jgi:hypothetical protein
LKYPATLLFGSSCDDFVSILYCDQFEPFLLVDANSSVFSGVSDVNCRFLRPVGGSQIWRSATLLAEALWASHRVEACSWEVTTVLGLPP